jgi:7-cyano-7-deazaguanine synthase
VKRAILLSGGIDSTALCYGFLPSLAITVDYGQLPAQAEIAASAEICGELGIPHEIVAADCSSVGAGTMSSFGHAAPGLAPTEEWWPFRNQLIVTLAACRAVVLGIEAIIIGSIATDQEHADGTPAFYGHLGALMGVQEGRLRVETPAIAMSSVELVRASRIPLSLLAWSHSCHRGSFACGTCRGCSKHMAVFDELFGDVSSLPVLDAVPE